MNPMYDVDSTMVQNEMRHMSKLITNPIPTPVPAPTPMPAPMHMHMHMMHLMYMTIMMHHYGHNYYQPYCHYYHPYPHYAPWNYSDLSK